MFTILKFACFHQHGVSFHNGLAPQAQSGGRNHGSQMQGDDFHPFLMDGILSQFL